MRVLIPARNEEARIGALLSSVQHALAVAQQLGATWDAELWVVLDRCTDGTRRVVEAHGVRALDCPSPGGKVEALRAGMSRQCDVHVCIDADVRVGARTLFDLVESLRLTPSVLAACPPLQPEPLVGLVTPLAWALYRYNAARGFSSERLWLSGRCYALRFATFPHASELARRARQVESARRFVGLSDPLSADDVWLSRHLLAQSDHAIVHVQTDPVCYRAPATWRGMSRTYRRLRRELRRIDLLFPELPGPGRDRRIEPPSGVADKLALAIFRAALALCRVHASAEEQLSAWRRRAPEPWPVVRESKLEQRS